jgi:hypothetical protein
MACMIEMIAGQKRSDIHFIMMKERKSAQRQKDINHLASTQQFSGFDFKKDTMDNWKSKIKKVRCLASLLDSIIRYSLLFLIK